MSDFAKQLRKRKLRVMSDAYEAIYEAADRIEALEAALREILQVGSATENLALWVAQDIASHALAGEKKDECN